MVATYNFGSVYANSSPMCIGSGDLTTWGLKGTIWHFEF